uniref:CCHC-type domain-containing protein n=1 Tax=Amblyomma aureolatum TaxID=187763 RepID=A0A1E1X400_9ACAR
MDLGKLKKSELILLCEELGIDKVGKSHRKPQLVEAIEECGAEQDEISEAWDEIQERARKAEEEAKERARKAEEEADRTEKERLYAKEAYERQLSLKRLELQIAEAEAMQLTAVSERKSRQDESEEIPGRERKVVRCFRCKKPGHLAFSCRNEIVQKAASVAKARESGGRTERSRETKLVVCLHCRKPGCVASACQKFQSASAESEQGDEGDATQTRAKCSLTAEVQREAPSGELLRDRPTAIEAAHPAIEYRRDGESESVGLFIDAVMEGAGLDEPPESGHVVREFNHTVVQHCSEGRHLGFLANQIRPGALDELAS